MTNIPTLYFAEPKRGVLPNPEEDGDVCIPNISPKERKKRLRFAVWQFLFTLLVLILLLVLEVDPLWRLSVFFLFSAATASYFQARDKT